MSGNRFGTLFQYQSWGESHGPAVGCVVDGVPPRIALSADDIQHFLDRRKPGGSRHVSQRRESDRVEILSGLFEGRTTGAPISLLIPNEDARPKDYDNLRDKFRPGHADYTYQEKYGIRDHRGGGRSSARETVARVAAGAIAHKILTTQIGAVIAIRGAVVQIGPHAAERSRFDWGQVDDNPFFAPDAGIVDCWADYLDDKRKNADSAGAIVEIVAQGFPPGLGAPVYDRLDADIAKAMMSINACKGVEIGAGFGAVLLGGTENGDAMLAGPDGKPVFASNHAGGILGGISTGQDIVVRLAMKPTSSVPTPRQSIDVNGRDVDVTTTGRHDPCVGIRAVPVAQAMMACVLADHWLRHKSQCL